MRKLLLAALIGLGTSGCSAPLESPASEISASATARDLVARGNYRFDFQRQCFCIREAVQEVTITVMDGGVRSAISTETGSDLALLPNLGWPTLDELLREVEAAREVGNLTSIEYGQQGYPTYVEIGSLAADAGVIYQIGPVMRIGRE